MTGPALTTAPDHPPMLTRAIGWISRWSVVAVTIVALATWSASRVLHLANADSLLPSLMSTQRLTWFYWGQDRLGNVVPTVAAPVRDERWNMTLQLFLIGLGWFTLAALFAANHLAGRRTAGVTRPVAPSQVAAATVIAGIVTWAALPAATELVFVFEQLYAFAFAMFLFGLWGVVQRGWGARAVGAAALGAAMLINPSLVLYAPAVAVFPGVTPLRWHGRQPRPAAPIVRAFAVAAVAFLATSLAARQFGAPPGLDTGYNEFSLGKSLDHVDDAFANVGNSLRHPAALLLVAAPVVWLAWRARTLTPRLWALYLAAPLFALAWTLLFSGNTWVLMNALFPRYFFPLYAVGLLYVSAAAADAAGLLAARLRAPDLASGTVRRIDPGDRRRRWPAVLPLLAGAGGLVGISRVELDTLVATRPWVDVIAAHDVDLAVGGYWATWPVVIEARAQGHDVLGVEGRAIAIDDLIAGRIRDDLAAGDRVTVLCTDSDAAQCTGTLNAWAPLPLAPGAVLSESPLVIEVVAAN